MGFSLTADHRKLIGNVREFGARHFSPGNVAQWRSDSGLPDEVVLDFVNLDFNGFGVTRRNAQGRYDLFAQTLVAEELARSSGATLPFSSDLLNLQIMEEFSDSSEFERACGQYERDGRLAFALAISEPQGGSDTMSMSTHTRSADGRIVLAGRKTFVNNGEYAPNLLVAAIDRDAEPGRHPALALWLVPHDAPGVGVYPIRKAGQSMMPFSDVVFDDVLLDERWRLKGRRTGFPQLFHLFEIGRLLCCATALGLAQAAMEDAVAYAGSRCAFGSSLSGFQMVQQMLVDMEVKLQNMRNSVYRAARMLDAGESDTETRLAVALCKRYVPEAATQVASDAMQIFGGRGYTANERVASIWEDCRGFQIAEGTDQIMVYIAAPLLMKKYDVRKHDSGREG